MATRKKCEICRSPLISGACPTPELHEAAKEAYTLEEKRDADIVKRTITLELKEQEVKQQQEAVRAAQKDLKNTMSQLDRADELRRMCADLVSQAEPQTFIKRKVNGKLPVHEWVLVLSDWHIGQLTTLLETGGLFEQNTPIAQEQVQTLWNAVDHLHDIESSGLSIRKLVILSLGDMVDGDLMRVSQTKKTDKVVAEQYPIMAGLMQAVVQQGLRLFDEVEVNIVGGNHDRFGKYGDAALGELAYIENYSFLMGSALEAAFAKEPRVSIRNHQSFFGTTIVNGYKLVFSHGSDVNWKTGAYGGVPYYPLHRAAEAMARMVGGFDLYIMGHGHTPIVMPIGFDSTILLNGSLPGSSTFVQSKFKSIRRPSQFLLSLHHEKGLTWERKLYLDHEGLKPEEDAWAEDLTPTNFEVDLTPARKRKSK